MNFLKVIIYTKCWFTILIIASTTLLTGKLLTVFLCVLCVTKHYFSLFNNLFSDEKLFLLNVTFTSSGWQIREMEGSKNILGQSLIWEKEARGREDFWGKWSSWPVHIWFNLFKGLDNFSFDFPRPGIFGLFSLEIQLFSECHLFYILFCTSMYFYDNLRQFLQCWEQLSTHWCLMFSNPTDTCNNKVFLNSPFWQSRVVVYDR